MASTSLTVRLITKFFAFEALEIVHGKSLKELQREKGFHLKFAAAGTKNGTMRIYRDEKAGKKGEWGAGLNPRFSKNFETVAVFDFSAWLQTTAAFDDHVILKMNIEGAEFSGKGLSPSILFHLGLPKYWTK